MIRKILPLLFILLMGADDLQSQTPFIKVVAQDGSGDFTTVQQAVDASAGSTRQVILFRNGVYEEQLTIPSGTTVSLLGESRDKAILSHNLAHKDVDDERQTSTIYLSGVDFYGQNFTTRHTAGRHGSQAECITVNADRATFKNVDFRAHQDGVRLNSSRRSYFKDCYIEGTVDYIFDSGVAYFDDCTIHQLYGGYITAPGETSATITRADSKAITGQNRIWGLGIFFRGCTLTYDKDNISPNSIYLGRPWGKTTCAAYYINCYMDNHIADAGWTDMGNNVANGSKAYVGEYGSMDLNGNLIDQSKRISWLFTEDEAHNSQYMTREVVEDLFDMHYVYAYVAQQNSNCSGTFNPLPLVEACEVPGNLQNNGTQLTWTAVPDALGYILYKDGTYLTNLTETTYALPTSSAGTYAICSVSPTGCMSEFATFSTATGWAERSSVNDGFRQDGRLVSVNDEADICLYDITGQVVKQVYGVNQIHLVDVAKGIYIIEVKQASGTLKKKLVIAD